MKDEADVEQTRPMTERDMLLDGLIARMLADHTAQLGQTDVSDFVARVEAERFEQAEPRAREFLARQTTPTLEALALDLARPDSLIGMRHRPPAPHRWGDLLTLLTTAGEGDWSGPRRASNLEDLLTFRDVFVRRHALTLFKNSLAATADSLRVAADRSLTDLARVAGYDAVADVLDITCVNQEFQFSEAGRRSKLTGRAAADEWADLTEGIRSMTPEFATWVLESRPSRIEIADALHAGLPQAAE